MQRLIAAQRLHSLYPPNNPNVKTAVGKLREALAGFGPGEPVHLDVDKESIRLGEQVVLPHVNEVRDLANKLYLAHVEALTFEPGLQDGEIISFLEVLKKRSDERGPFDEELPSRGVEHIVVREAGRLKIVEAEADPDSWDIASLAEFEDLDRKLTGGAGKGVLREALRTVGSGQDLKRQRLLGVLERPQEFAQLLVELASRLKPRSTVDLNAQLALLQALVGQMETVLEALPENDRIRTYGKLDEVVAALAQGLHQGVISQPRLPYVRLGAIASLFPERLREMSLEEALGAGLRPGPGLLPVLLNGLRRLAAGDSHLSAHLAVAAPPPAAPDPALLAAYRPAPRPAAAKQQPELTADFYAAASTGVIGMEERMLASAGKNAIGVIDSLATLIDLMAAETDPAAYAAEVSQVVDRLALGLNLKNLDLSTSSLAALRAERMLKNDAAPMVAVLDQAIRQCGDPEMMTLYARMLAETLTGSEEQKRTADLLQSLESNAISSLVEILAAENLQSTRKKLLDVLATVARQHFDLLSSYLTHPQWYVVRNVVWLMGRMGPEAAAVVRRVSMHKEPRVRREAVRSLAQIGGGEAIKALFGYLHDRDDAVLREAATRLTALRIAEAVPALHAVLQSPTFPDREAETMLTLARALAASGGAESAALLERTSEAKVVKGWLKAPEVRKGLKDAAAAIHKRLGGGTA